MTEEAAQHGRAATEPEEAAACVVVQLVDRGGRGVEQRALDRAVAQPSGFSSGAYGGSHASRSSSGCAATKSCTILARWAFRRSQDTRSGWPIRRRKWRRAAITCAVDAAPEVAGVRPRRAAEGRNQGCDAGDLPPLAEPPQDRRVAPAGLGGAEAGPKRVTRLVQEGKGTPLRRAPFGAAASPA